ncbi:hypothetical protein AYO38_03770 [bacterium SCGC AG-212-C10]|nr:hypothetical protein AYO38_03770 [bacterium SCGC AG-212-C10]
MIEALPPILDALAARGLLDDYARRSLAQREHYVRRILRAVRPATAQKRLDQMLDELEGDSYMGRPLSGTVIESRPWPPQFEHSFGRLQRQIQARSVRRYNCGHRSI